MDGDRFPRLRKTGPYALTWLLKYLMCSEHANWLCFDSITSMPDT